jgi:hypothetical protein
MQTDVTNVSRAVAIPREGQKQDRCPDDRGGGQKKAILAG